ncbi:hypothetical protein GCM10027435_13020 [Haloparvum alkalitolerans]|uniref:hypothetical protein n=1 Tax=Haloparvum alkalitolerans TaxID=1042953 RepID=UPI003CF2499D
MFTRAYQSAMFGLHQLTVAVGIALFPLALAARRSGVPSAIRRLVEATGAAYERAAD